MPLPEVHRRVCDWLRREARREQTLREMMDPDLINRFRPLLN